MARQRGGELLTGRNLAIAGTSLLVATAAGVGYSRWQRAQAERPDLQLAWNYKPFDQKVPRQTADISAFAGRAFRHHVAVLTVDGRAYGEQLSRSEGTPALAVHGDDGKWYAAVLPEGELGETGEVHILRKAVAVRLGSPALTEVQLGIMDEEQYVPFDTEALDISEVRDIRREYPDVPLLGLPPIEFGMPDIAQ
jgi:hypothetical protein